MKDKIDIVDWISRLDPALKRRGLKYAFKIKTQPKTHEESWVIVLVINGKLVAEAANISKRRAEHEAAKAGIEWLKREDAQAARTKGSRNETTVLEALCSPSYPLPPWFVSARAATSDEDAKGIDVVVQSADLGHLLLQIKSSRIGERKFLAQGRRSSLIGIVIIETADGIADVLQKTIVILEELRKKIRQSRGDTIE